MYKKLLIVAASLITVNAYASQCSKAEAQDQAMTIESYSNGNNRIVASDKLAAAELLAGHARNKIADAQVLNIWACNVINGRTNLDEAHREALRNKLTSLSNELFFLQKDPCIAIASASLKRSLVKTVSALAMNAKQI
jgi:hypothetical protein